MTHLTNSALKYLLCNPVEVHKWKGKCSGWKAFSEQQTPATKKKGTFTLESGRQSQFLTEKYNKHENVHLFRSIIFNGVIQKRSLSNTVQQRPCEH